MGLEDAIQTGMLALQPAAKRSKNIIIGQFEALYILGFCERRDYQGTFFLFPIIDDV